MPRHNVPYVTGSAECPDAVQAHFGMTPYRRRALIVCGRVCVRELEPMGLTPDGLELASNKPCGENCKEARILFPPNGVIPQPEV